MGNKISELCIKAREKSLDFEKNNSHGWDVCPNANGSCFFARNEEVFHRTCSVNYEECEIKLLLDYGGIR